MKSLYSHLRALARIVALCVATAFIYLLWASITPFLLVWPQACYRWRNFNFRSWARLTNTLLGIRVESRGTPPRIPFFLVSNHLSYMDIVAFASRLDCVFVAKSEVANWPVLGLLCRSMGTIFVNRNSRVDVLRVNRVIEKALRNGKGVLLFPEGTSTPGTEVLPFHSALLEPAVQQGCPVSFATVSYRTPVGQPPAHLSVCWWGEMSFLAHFYQLLHLKSVEAALVFGSYSIRADDRKVLARKLWQAVSEELIPVVETDSAFANSIASDVKRAQERPLHPHAKRARSAHGLLEEPCKTLTHSSDKTLEYLSRAWKS
jgi:1-acyl-sn-glycerol-3-phosphate acyltransferase